jgi:hypothetical protein
MLAILEGAGIPTTGASTFGVTQYRHHREVVECTRLALVHRLPWAKHRKHTKAVE